MARKCYISWEKLNGEGTWECGVEEWLAILNGLIRERNTSKDLKELRQVSCVYMGRGLEG